MPRYIYDCLDCKIQFETQHSYKFKGTVCTGCSSPKVNKNLSKVVNIKRVPQENNSSIPIGSEVNGSISENKEELKTMKNTLQGKVYKK